MDREFADEILELIKAEPEHLVVLPAKHRGAWNGRRTETWIFCHASIDEAGEYDLRPVAEVIGPRQRLRWRDYLNPLVNIRKETQ
jgi:hypothetical protein